LTTLIVRTDVAAQAVGHSGEKEEVNEAVGLSEFTALEKVRHTEQSHIMNNKSLRIRILWSMHLAWS